MIADIVNKKLLPSQRPLTDEQLEQLINDLYDGRVSVSSLPEGLYKETAKLLKKALYHGYGGNLEDFTEEADAALLEDLRENVYMFSAAKTFQQVREMSDALTDSEGIIPFSEFKQAAKDIFLKYNGGEDAAGEFKEGWLHSEYNTAVGQAQNAWKWNQIEKKKETFPYLQYNAVGDSSTCEICDSMDGITLPVDDEFWDTKMPPNHFNCQCIVEQIDKYEDAEESSDEEVTDAEEQADDHMLDEFQMNPGKDRVIFSDKHPYFDVEPRYKGYAEENFGLPIPEED